jgi:hypothetical protein
MTYLVMFDGGPAVESGRHRPQAFLAPDGDPWERAVWTAREVGRRARRWPAGGPAVTVRMSADTGRGTVDVHGVIICRFHVEAVDGAVVFLGRRLQRILRTVPAADR